MGTTSSKHPSNRDGWNAHLSRSVSVPTNSVRVEAESFGKSLWKSRPFSMRKSSYAGNDLSNTNVMSGKQLGNVRTTKTSQYFSKLQPVNEEEPCQHYEDQFELVGVRESKEGLPNDFRTRQAPSADASETSSKRRLLGRSVSFRAVHEGQVDGRSSIWRKGISEDESCWETPSYLTSSANPTYSRSSSCRNVSSMDKGTGLRFLLSPVVSTPPSSTSANTGATLNKSLSLSMKGKSDTFTGFCTTSSVSRSPSMREITAPRADWMATASMVEPSSPLFDPSILASFEKAVEAVSDESWQSSDVSTRSSGITSSSLDNLSDADSPELFRTRGANVDSIDIRSNVFNIESGTYMGAESGSVKTDVSYSKKLSFSKVSPLDYRDWDGQVSLESFETKCPPGGEGKIVLYFTSLRGIRRTFEDCCNLRLILGGFRMHVDERDIWMHSKFRHELTELMGMPLSVPRLFIKGRYIGGADEVKQLHELGLLGKLFEGLPTGWKKGCDVCGGVRFIPCTTCGGSCKIITEDDGKVRCPDCNENGLIMCPSCY